MLDALFLVAPGWAMLTAFLVTCGLSVLLVLTKSVHGRFSIDGASGVQKMHKAPTPRIGGIGIYLGLLAASYVLWDQVGDLLRLILVAGIPAFAAGLAEDLTKKVSPKWRLIATIISGFIFAVPMGFAVLLTDTQWLMDGEFFSYTAAVLIVAVGMGGVANAVNITDGYHGLAAGSFIMMALAFAGLAVIAQDWTLARVALVVASGMAGFFVVNFPFGKIFLGDAGAYFAGVVLAALGIMVTARNPEISPFVSLLVLFYPVYETLFSIHRKRRRDGSSPTQPDGVHMHMLVSRTFARPLARMIDHPEARNALSAIMMWPFPMVCSLMAIATWGSGRGAVLGCLIFALLYGRIYRLVSLQASPLLRPTTARPIAAREDV